MAKRNPSLAPVLSLVAARIARAQPTVEQTDTLEFQLQVLETMLNAYFNALYSQIDIIRNHPEVLP